jgi:hypothetical protein
MSNSTFNLRNVFLANALVYLIFALALLIGPETVLRLLRLSSDNPVIFLARLFGGSLVGLGLIAWFARDFADLKARDAASVSLFLTAVLAFIVTLLATLANWLRVAGWPISIIFLALALSYGYLQFVRRGE